MNQVSHFLDGSMIYGSTLKKSRELREFEGGRLMVRSEDHQEYLLTSSLETSFMCMKDCYDSGNYTYLLLLHL